jgi:fibronectin-binding autotransporter adhesin
VPTGGLTLPQTLVVGGDEVRLLSNAPTVLSSGATIAGGTLYAPNGILLDGSNAVTGAGIVFGGATGTNAANGWLGSGALTLTSALNAGDGPVTLLAGSPVGVAAAVTLGGGTLRAPSGLLLDSGGSLTGPGVVEARVSGTGSITLDGSLTLGDAASIVGVAYNGNATVGAHTFTLRDADFASLGGATTIAGGTITAANGLTLPVGSTLAGFGTVAGSMWNAGTITATGGDLTMGSPTGTYFSDQSGVLNVGAGKVTLLGTSVTLGNSTTLAGGQLVAPSGFIYGTTRKVSGYGTIRTENSVGLDATMATPTGALTVGTNVAVGTDTLTFLSNADTVLNAALTLAGGRLTGSGFGLAIGSSGSVSGYGTINQPVTNAGTINVTASQQLTINGLFANTGTVNPTGTLRLTAGGSLGGTFGVGSLALDGGTYALPSAWAIPAGLTVGLNGSTFAGPGALQIATGATLRVAGAGGTLTTAATNAGTLALAGSLGGTGTLTNQGLLRAEEILSGGNPAYPFIGVHAAVGVATTNAASGTVQVSAGRALEFLSLVTNAGALDVGGTMRFGGALTHTGTATVAGTLDIRGGGTSTGAITLAGGSVVFNGLGGTFTVANAATGLTGSGGLNFASGTTVLNYGVTAAPVTINQNLSFTGGTLELPGATSLRTSSLLLDRRYFEITGLVASVGSTPNLPTTVLAGGNFGWARARCGTRSRSRPE